MKRETLLNAARMGRGVISLDVRLMDDVATPPPLPHQSTKPPKKNKKKNTTTRAKRNKTMGRPVLFLFNFFFLMR